MPHLTSRFVGLTAALLFQPGSAFAAGLLDAVRIWFGTDPSTTCVGPDGNNRRCAINRDTNVDIWRPPGAYVAIAFVTYLSDPADNEPTTVAATFQEEATAWRHVRTLSEVWSASVGKVTFGDHAATFALSVPRAGNARCCPRRPQAPSRRHALRSDPARWRSPVAMWMASQALRGGPPSPLFGPITTAELCPWPLPSRSRIRRNLTGCRSNGELARSSAHSNLGTAARVD